METQKGIELTEEEIKLVKSLKRIANKWKKVSNRLWLFSASGTLKVMMYGDSPTNREPEFTELGGANPDNIITNIDIPNDGGDW